ncbi:MAG: hypothetical protein R8M37_03485 [Alphaproteobacteria bacterium]|nr:hypothetical protein [Alphaproteobacteria bacterium]
MNEFLKAQVLNAIANGVVVSTSRLGSASYVVYNTKGERLLSVNNDWDYGAYNLIINGNVVLFADANVADKKKPIDTIVNEIAEICNACSKRWHQQKEQEAQMKKLEIAKQAMTKTEAELANFLNGVKRQHTI